MHSVLPLLEQGTTGFLFIGVKFTQQNINHFKANNTGTFRILTLSNHPTSSSRTFSALKHCRLSVSPSLPSPSTWQPLTCFCLWGFVCSGHFT